MSNFYYKAEIYSHSLY